eukprot:m.145993 g.145993  ORF g.145993 m.145993 type:complete len:186 (+) comp24293_c1_seq4:185-742(+)
MRKAICFDANFPFPIPQELRAQRKNRRRIACPTSTKPKPETVKNKQSQLEVQAQEQSRLPPPALALLASSLNLLLPQNLIFSISNNSSSIAHPAFDPQLQQSGPAQPLPQHPHQHHHQFLEIHNATIKPFQHLEKSQPQEKQLEKQRRRQLQHQHQHVQLYRATTAIFKCPAICGRPFAAMALVG